MSESSRGTKKDEEIGKARNSDAQVVDNAIAALPLLIEFDVIATVDGGKARDDVEAGRPDNGVDLMLGAIGHEQAVWLDGRECSGFEVHIGLVERLEEVVGDEDAFAAGRVAGHELLHECLVVHGLANEVGESLATNESVFMNTVKKRISFIR